MTFSKVCQGRMEGSIHVMGPTRSVLRVGDGTREITAREGGIRNARNPGMLHRTKMSVHDVAGAQRETSLQRRHHFALFLAVDEIVVILHRDKRRELVMNSVILHHSN